MASALLASRNEPAWGEGKVHMRNYGNNVISSSTTSNNPFLKLNPNAYSSSSHNAGWKSSHENQRLSTVHFRKSEGKTPVRTAFDPPVRKLQKASEVKKEQSDGGYVTFNLRAHSRGELKELKQRLTSELEQVRRLRNRIVLNDFGSMCRFPVSQYSEIRPQVKEKTTPVTASEFYAVASELENAKKTKKKKNETEDPIVNKKGSGIKRKNHFESVKHPKKPAVDPTAERTVSTMMKRCGVILTKLMTHKHGWVFNKPVDVVGLKLHNYHLIVSKPMDLGTVKSNLEKHLYSSPMDFASDVRLTFNNALLYNPQGTDVNLMANLLLSRFDGMFNPAYEKFKSEHRQQAVQNMVSERINKAPSPPPPVRAQIPPGQAQVQTQMLIDSSPATKSVRLLKPKAKDLNKREMSMEEKTMLGMGLQSLPPEKMGQLVHILRKRNGDLAQDGDEIELDIEAIDTETLWELDRFVTNYRKMLSKIKRQEVMNMNNYPVSASQTSSKSPRSEKEENFTAAAQKSKKGVEFEEEYVDIGEEIPMSNFPPVVIDKDPNGSSASSTSSSCRDSSSSSDSGSGSSTGSDSGDDDCAKSPCAVQREAIMSCLIEEGSRA